MAHKKGKDHIRPGFDYWYSFIGQGKYIDPPVNDNGKEYIEVHSFTTKTQYFVTNIEWD